MQEEDIQLNSMRLIMKINIALLLCIPLILCGCAKGKIETISNEQTVQKMEHTSFDQTESGRYMVVPILYQQNYEDVTLGSSSVAEIGGGITTLCMAISYATGNLIEPGEFINEYQSYIDQNGNVDIDACLENSNIWMYETRTFDFQDMVNTMGEDKYTICLIEINHKSPFGTGASYLIITGSSDEGYLCVRDPDLNNKEKYEIKRTMYGESLYGTADILAAAGNNANAYYVHLGVSE